MCALRVFSAPLVTSVLQSSPQPDQLPVLTLQYHIKAPWHRQTHPAVSALISYSRCLPSSWPTPWGSGHVDLVGRQWNRFSAGDWLFNHTLIAQDLTLRTLVITNPNRRLGKYRAGRQVPALTCRRGSCQALDCNCSALRPQAV